MSHYEFEKQLQEQLGLRYRPVRFTNRELALSYSNNTSKMSFVVLGSDNRFWVVCGSDFNRLSKQGFEIAA